MVKEVGQRALQIPASRLRGRDLRTGEPTQSYRRGLMRSYEPHAAASLLAPLNVGDRLPWKLDRHGEPQWLTVIEVVSDVSYVIRYPDGTTELLVDSE
jgi:hypothetical protein